MQRWTVELDDEFEPEFNNLHEDVSVEILALSRLLQEFGPQLVAGSKSGVSEKRFYRQIIAKADERFDAHLNRLKKERK
jgi:hypothetical protein